MSGEANSDCEALIVGAGFSGVYLLHRLREGLARNCTRRDTRCATAGTEPLRATELI